MNKAQETPALMEFIFHQEQTDNKQEKQMNE